MIVYAVNDENISKQNPTFNVHALRAILIILMLFRKYFGTQILQSHDWSQEK